MELKPGYKQTEVGVIPVEWDVSTIVETMELINGRAFKPSEWSRLGLPIIRIQNLNNEDSDFNYFPGYIDERNRVKKGDLLFAWSGTLGSSFGARIWAGSDGVLNQHIFKVIPNPRKLTHEYAHVVFRRIEEDIAKKAHGFKSSFVHVKKSDLDATWLPIPPIGEQHAIATALSDVDALLQGLEQLIAKKRNIKKAAMQQLLTGQQRLPGFAGEWEVKHLGEIIDLLADYTANGSFEALKSNVTYYESRNYAALVRTTDLDKTKFAPERFTDERGYNFLSKTALFGGELIVANVGSIGKVFRVPSYEMPMTLAPNTYLLKFTKNTNEDYIYQWLRTDEFYSKLMSKIGSSTLQAINKENLKSIEICLPSMVEEQTAIATVLSDMDAEITALEQQREKTHELKQGMLQQLLIGHIRLV